jgi:hypothetical protein
MSAAALIKLSEQEMPESTREMLEETKPSAHDAYQLGWSMCFLAFKSYLLKEA